MKKILVDVNDLSGEFKGLKHIMVLPHRDFNMKYITTDFETSDGEYDIFKLEDDLFFHMGKKDDLVAVKVKPS